MFGRTKHIYSIYNTMKKRNKEFEDLSEEEKEYMEVIEDKLEDIERAGSKKFTETEVKECPNFERVKEKTEKIPFLF